MPRSRHRSLALLAPFVHQRMSELTLKNRTILDAFAGAQAIRQHQMPGSVAVRVARLTAALRAEAAHIIEERDKILAGFTEKGEDGKPVPVKDDAGKVLEGRVKLTDPAAFIAAEKELYDAENTVSVPVLSESDVEKITSVQPEAIEVLLPFVVAASPSTPSA